MQQIITDSAAILDALAALNALSGKVMTLLVVNPAGCMVGTLTDGDVRRALLAGCSLQAPVTHAMNRRFCSLTPTSDPAEIRRLRLSGISLLPILDSQGHIIDILNLRQQLTRLPLRAVLMAGGRGERLRPLTDSTPKPLLPLGDATVIDRNISALRRYGVPEIIVTVRYLAEQIEQHFANTEVKCAREPNPLGTIGALSLLPAPAPGGTTLLMNSDLFTTIDFEDFYLRHQQEQNDITIATVSHTVSIPFAVLTTNGARVTGIDEKPTYTHYANAGIYLISNHMLRELKPGRLDAPDFIADRIAAGAKVGHFPITGTWLDIGTPADYRQAQELLSLLPR